MTHPNQYCKTCEKLSPIHKFCSDRCRDIFYSAVKAKFPKCKHCRRLIKNRMKNAKYCLDCAPLIAKSLARSNHNKRRARKNGLYVSPKEYQQVMKSGDCVYCGDNATHVDHITPLAKGGHEALYNLVPSCAKCNISKNALFLYQWNPMRVAHALEISPAVRAEYARQQAGAYPC